MSRSRSQVSGLIATALGRPTMAAESLVLAEGGRARAAIVVAEDAPAPEKHAAQELAAFLKQVTGAAFAVFTGAEPQE